MDVSKHEDPFYNVLEDAIWTAFAHVFDHHLERIKMMKEENEKQEKNSTPVNSSMDVARHEDPFYNVLEKALWTAGAHVFDYHLERIKKMKEEKEKLKKQNASWREYKNVAEQDIDNMRDNMGDILGKELAWNECLKEVKKMKEENEKLRVNSDLYDEIQMTQQKREDAWKHDYEVAEMRKKKIEEVMKENKKLKEEIFSLETENVYLNDYNKSGEYNELRKLLKHDVIIKEQEDARKKIKSILDDMSMKIFDMKLNE